MSFERPSLKTIISRTEQDAQSRLTFFYFQFFHFRSPQKIGVVFNSETFFLTLLKSLFKQKS